MTRNSTEAPAGGALRAAILSFLALAACVPLALSAQHENHAAPKPGGGLAQEALDGPLSIPDVTVTTQDGEQVRFYTDLVKDRVVAMNFIFTTCTTICPPLGALFGRLQENLREQPELDVQLLSVSVDPVIDTPERLKEWREKLGGDPGWTLVTGAKSDIDRLLKVLQVFTPEYEDHSPTLLLGNEAADLWQRTYGLAAPQTIADLLIELSAEGEDR